MGGNLKDVFYLVSTGKIRVVLEKMMVSACLETCCLPLALPAFLYRIFDFDTFVVLRKKRMKFFFKLCCYSYLKYDFDQRRSYAFQHGGAT